MNFQDLGTIEPASFYLDLAFRRARERVALKKDTIKNQSKRDLIKKTKLTEEIKIRGVEGCLVAKFDKILTSFPTIDDLPPFYNKLIKITIDYAELKKSLGAISWAILKVKGFANVYSQKIAKGTDVKYIQQQRASFYGRISSVIKQIDRNLRYLEESRRIMKGFPNVKTKVFTVALFGFPNIGKTTLLSKVTGSKPEINSYAFTTKKLNIGNFQLKGKKVQIIDTPGTLNRFDKMNPMEQQAQLVLTHAADMIVYIYDLTEPFPLTDQKKLLNKVREFKLPIVVYLTKKDIIDKKVFEEFKQEHHLDSPEELKKAILERWVDKKKELDEENPEE